MSQGQSAKPKIDGTCDVNWDDYLKTYYEKPQSSKTWSGFDVKELYDPADGADKDYQVEVGDAGMPNCEELLLAAIQEGLTVKACRVCTAERGLSQEELTKGVEIASMADLVDWIASSDRTVSL